MSLHEEALGRPQRDVLRQLSRLMNSRGFYLGGGTAVALHLGHRRSVDLDWFTRKSIADADSLAVDLRDAGAPFSTRAALRGTLHGSISGVRVSFLEYRYPLLHSLVEWPEMACQLASLDDLACMKLSAVAQRGAKRDFLDLYAIGQGHCSLARMLEMYQRKYELKNISHVIYSLAYFDDAEKEPMPRMLWKVAWKHVKSTIQSWVREQCD